MELIFKYKMEKWDLRVNFSIWPMEPWNFDNEKGNNIKKRMSKIRDIMLTLSFDKKKMHTLNPYLTFTTLFPVYAA